MSRPLLDPGDRELITQGGKSSVSPSPRGLMQVVLSHTSPAALPTWLGLSHFREWCL